MGRIGASKSMPVVANEPVDSEGNLSGANQRPVSADDVAVNHDGRRPSGPRFRPEQWRALYLWLVVSRATLN